MSRKSTARKPAINLVFLLAGLWKSSVKSFILQKSLIFGKRLTNNSLRQSNLIPEENPHANPDATSKAGVRYGTVISGLSHLFEPKELDKRNALSRSDGYWPYISDEDGPPQGMVGP